MKKYLLMLIAAVFTLETAWADDAGRIPAKGFAIYSKDGKFQEHNFTRHAVGDNDVQIEILYAGICHSDLHAAWDEHRRFGINAIYPMIPGHEIAGRVVKVGKNVTGFRVGDYAGVGCMVNSCGKCEYCKINKEQYCQNGTAFTYNSIDPYNGNEATMGGYSNCIVVTERFAVKIPAGADLKRVAPLLCAGVTTWSPIVLSNVKKGDTAGVAGYGGLGHMALRYLVDRGANVTVFDISEAKRADALRMGAKRFVNVTRPEDLRGLENSFDFIISTIPADYEPLIYVKMLKYAKGELAIVGLPDNSNINISAMVLAAGQRRVYGSLIGGIKETQEMLDYSVAHNLYPEVELIKADAGEIDKAYRNVLDGKVKFRYVIDMSTLK